MKTINSIKITPTTAYIFSKISHLIFSLVYFQHLFPVPIGIHQMGLFQGFNPDIRDWIVPYHIDSVAPDILIATNHADREG
jgi:hypothetical protein